MIQLGLIGWPLSFSLSPTIHGLFLEQCGIDGNYTLWPTESPCETLLSLQSKGVLGCNVTIPHKRAVIELMDSLSPQASAINAVNTVRFLPNGKREGHNTDILGFQNDFADFIQGCSPSAVLLMGAGGAASAVIFALRQAYPGVSIYCATRKAVAIEGTTNVPWSDIPSLAPRMDAIINATPLGKKDPSEIPLDWKGLNTTTHFYDLNYCQEETALTLTARQNGLPARDGLGMLIGQAAEAFALWTNQRPFVDAALSNLVRRQTK